MLVFNTKGDTIVEVLIALAVIGSVIITSSLAVDGIATNNRNNYTRQQAIQVLQNQMELVKAANINIPTYSLNNLFNLVGNLPADTTKSNNFCAYIASPSNPIPVSTTQFKIDKSNCKFDQSGIYNESTGFPSSTNAFYDINLNLVKVSGQINYYNLQGEIDWLDQGRTLNSNVKLTYELVNSQ